MADNLQASDKVGVSGPVFKTQDDGTAHWPESIITPAISSVVEAQTSAALAAAGSDTLDFAAFGSGTTGKLLAVTMCSTAAGKYVISTRDGAVIVNVATIVLQPFESKTFRPETKHSATLAYTGGDENFRVVVTNLGAQAADFYVTCEWDEE